MAREPLLHFLLIGGALFLLLGGGEEPPAPDEIVISAGQVRNLATLFERTWQRPPSEAELDALIRERVDEEILAREARALGLDRDDTVIRRRLRQKMEFVSQDLMPPDPPDEAELQAHLAANPDLFARPARISFTQVFLDPDRRGDSLPRDAARLLEALNGADAPTDPRALGDPSLLDASYAGATPDEVAGQFGAAFADRLQSLPPDRWVGPVPSPFGSHLVRIEARSEPVLPPLDEVREEVAWEVEAARRDAAQEAFLQALRERYEVRVERPEPSVAAAGREPDPSR